MAVTKMMEASDDEVWEAKQTAVALIGGDGEKDNKEYLDLLYAKSLDEIEIGVKNLNNMADRAWLLSGIIIYTMIYNGDLYAQSGLSWAEYSGKARERLGLDPKTISQQLSAARFFIKHREKLLKAGWTPDGGMRKLARAELAYELSGNLNATIKHIVNDTCRAFQEWYTTFKTPLLESDVETIGARKDIDVSNFSIGGKKAVHLSEEIEEKDRVLLYKCLSQIFSIMKSGDYPAIVSAYDEKEARHIPILRDKYRSMR